jgi:hypothetical protein
MSNQALGTENPEPRMTVLISVRRNLLDQHGPMSLETLGKVPITGSHNQAMSM